MNAIVEEKQVETCFSLLRIQTKCCSTRKNEFFSHLCSSGTCQPISTSDSSTRLSAPQRHETHHIDLMSPMPSKIPYTTCEPNKLLLNEWMLVLPQFISEEAKNQRDYKCFSGNHTAGQSWENKYELSSRWIQSISTIPCLNQGSDDNKQNSTGKVPRTVTVAE